MSLKVHGDKLEFPDSSFQYSAAFPPFRNLLDNGTFAIDQRNEGAAVSSTGKNHVAIFAADRWMHLFNHTGASSLQRMVNSDGTYPKHYLRRTITTAAASIGSTDYEWTFHHRIEGLNLRALKWGTAEAKDVSLSFKVRSSVVGTFSVVLAALGAGGNQFVFEQVTIDQADVWEYKSVTFPGNTTHAIKNDNTAGIYLYFATAVGSSYQGTVPGVWSASAYLGTASNTNFAASLNSTFDIAEAQLEIGGGATEFEHRPYSVELAMCQRYFQTLWGMNPTDQLITSGVCYNSTTGIMEVRFAPMRTDPACSVSAASDFSVLISGGSYAISTINFYSPSRTGFVWLEAVMGASTFVAGDACALRATSSARLNFSAEL